MVPGNTGSSVPQPESEGIKDTDHTSCMAYKRSAGAKLPRAAAPKLVVKAAPVIFAAAAPMPIRNALARII